MSLKLGRIGTTNFDNSIYEDLMPFLDELNSVSLSFTLSSDFVFTTRNYSCYYFPSLGFNSAIWGGVAHLSEALP